MELEKVELTGTLFGQKAKVVVPIYGKCPLCGEGYVYKHQAGFLNCSAWEENKCPLSINLNFMEANISDENVFKLLNDGITDMIKGLKGKNGTYNAQLSIALSGDFKGKITFYKSNDDNLKNKISKDQGEPVNTVKGIGEDHPF